MAHASDRRRWRGGSEGIGGETASKTQIYALFKARSHLPDDGVTPLGNGMFLCRCQLPGATPRQKLVNATDLLIGQGPCRVDRQHILQGPLCGTAHCLNPAMSMQTRQHVGNKTPSRYCWILSSAANVTPTCLPRAANDDVFRCVSTEVAISGMARLRWFWTPRRMVDSVYSFH